MCEQAARSCRAGVHRLLRKPPPALRGLDGLLRWVVARMSDKGVADRELLTPGASSQRKGTSVILDVSAPAAPRLGGGGICPATRIPHRRRCPLPQVPLHPSPAPESPLHGSCNPKLGLGMGVHIPLHPPTSSPTGSCTPKTGLAPGFFPGSHIPGWLEIWGASRIPLPCTPRDD